MAGRESVEIHDERIWTQDLDGQTSIVRLNAVVEAYSFAKPAASFVSVTLANSAVSASKTGKLVIDRDDLRGWFTERVDVVVKCTPTLTVIQDSPSTTLGSETTSSSTGINVNESLGSFGPVPVVNVGGGVTIGSSFSRNLTDIKIINLTSNEDGLFHQYMMDASSGGAYSTPKDLVDMSAGGQFTGCPLFTVPDIVVANMPLVSQAIFNGPASLVGQTIRIDVSIKHHLRKTEKTFELFNVKINTNETIVTHLFSCQITIPAPI